MLPCFLYIHQGRQKEKKIYAHSDTKEVPESRKGAVEKDVQHVPVARQRESPSLHFAIVKDLFYLPVCTGEWVGAPLKLSISDAS